MWRSKMNVTTEFGKGQSLLQAAPGSPGRSVIAWVEIKGRRSITLLGRRYAGETLALPASDADQFALGAIAEFSEQVVIILDTMAEGGCIACA